MLECVPNVSEGRRPDVIDALTAAAGDWVLDVHADPDHNRSVFTIGEFGESTVEAAVRRLAIAVASLVDLRHHHGVHPRLGALDVVPFVARQGTAPSVAVEAAREFGEWVARELSLPVFLYDETSLPTVRRDAFTRRSPDFGPQTPHPELGAVAVGARPPLVAVNCRLDTDDVALARAIATQVRERDGGLPGVRALGFALASKGNAQVSMNVTRLEACGVERACTAVRRLAYEGGADVAEVELVGLLPLTEWLSWSAEFREWSQIDYDQTIEKRDRDRLLNNLTPD